MILVTGATGFLGSKLLRHLSRSHQVVRAIARDLKNISSDLRLPNVEWIHGDILDVISLEEAMNGVERVYHCAAIVSFDERDHERMMLVNTKGTANVVNASLTAGVKKLLHVSSTAALGRSHQGVVITEEAEWKTNKNNSVYALSKYLAEREVWRGTQEGLPAVIVNPSVIIGAGDWKRGTPRLFHSCRRGMRVYPKGTNAFVYIDDVVSCMMELMNGTFENERYILSGENMSYKDFFQLITKTLEAPQPQIALPEWTIGVMWRVAALLHRAIGVYPLLTRETARTVSGKNLYSNEKIKRTLNYEFVPAQKFVVETAQAYKNQLGRS